MRIDVHCHYNPRRLLEAAAALGIPTGPLPPHPDSLDDRLLAMDAAKVDLAVMWPTFQPYLEHAPDAVAFARLTNDTYRAVMARHPGRFSAWGCLPLPHVEAAVAEAERCLDELGFVGLGFGCSVAGRPLDHEAFWPLWEMLDRRQVPVFIHPGQVVSGMPGATQWLLGPCISSPAEIALAGARLILSGLTTRFPSLKIVLATGGGSLPYASGKIQHLLSLIPDLAPFKGDFRGEAGRLYYDTSFPAEPVKYRALCDLCGPSHILFGSDQPFGSMLDTLHEMATSGHLSAAEQHAILDENAARVLMAAAEGVQP